MLITLAGLAAGGRVGPSERSLRRDPFPSRPHRSNTHITSPYITAKLPPDTYNTHKTLLQLAAAGARPDEAASS